MASSPRNGAPGVAAEERLAAESAIGHDDDQITPDQTALDTSAIRVARSDKPVALRAVFKNAIQVEEPPAPKVANG